MTDDNEPATREWWRQVAHETGGHQNEAVFTTGSRPTWLTRSDDGFQLCQLDEDNRLDMVELGPLTKHRVRELLRGLGVKCKS